MRSKGFLRAIAILLGSSLAAMAQLQKNRRAMLGFALCTALSVTLLHSASASPCATIATCRSGELSGAPAVGEFPYCSCSTSCPSPNHAETCSVYGDQWSGYEVSCECEWVEPSGPPTPPQDPSWDPWCFGFSCPDGSAPLTDGYNCYCRGGSASSLVPGRRPGLPRSTWNVSLIRMSQCVRPSVPPMSRRP